MLRRSIHPVVLVVFCFIHEIQYKKLKLYCSIVLCQGFIIMTLPEDLFCHGK